MEVNNKSPDITSIDTGICVFVVDFHKQYMNDLQTALIHRESRKQNVPKDARSFSSDLEEYVRGIETEDKTKIHG